MAVSFLHHKQSRTVQPVALLCLSHYYQVLWCLVTMPLVSQQARLHLVHGRLKTTFALFIILLQSGELQCCFLLEHSDSRFESIRRFVLVESICSVKKIGHSIRPLHSPDQWSYAHSPILRRCISHCAVQLILLTLRNMLSCYNWRHSRRLCEVVRVTRDDGVELTFDNIINDSCLYG